MTERMEVLDRYETQITHALYLLAEARHTLAKAGIEEGDVTTYEMTQLASEQITKMVEALQAEYRVIHQELNSLRSEFFTEE